MSDFRFFYPVQIRYADLDAQWHVNNARFLTILEQARLAYVRQLGLWDGKSFLDLGLIVADVHIAYKAPIELEDEIQVALKVSRIGKKSMSMENEIRGRKDGSLKALAEIIMVTYDFHSKTTIPVPENWRKKITEFEGL
ncbi:MAG TPA: thioesterase family protein [Anaerolineaceae bacterium]|nr:thioesterase family protein [Anaerolineaceae bacterium]